MAKIDLDLENLTIPEKIALAKKFVKALTDDPNFPNPNPPLAEIRTAIEEAERAYQEAQIAISAANEAEDKFQAAWEKLRAIDRYRTVH